MPLIDAKSEIKIHDYMLKQFIEIGCPIRMINGMPGHIHCLFLLSPKKSISEVIKQIKGITSHFVNEQNLISEKFAWQTGYAAYSVSESQLEKVFQYIKNPKKNHSKQSFQQEYDEFLKLFGFSNI
jgi:putative transposase